MRQQRGECGFAGEPPRQDSDAALVLVDHQVGLLTGVRDIAVGELKSNVVSLAKAMRTLKVPTVVTTTARDSLWGPTFPELVSALPDAKIIDRSTVNAWDDRSGRYRSPLRRIRVVHGRVVPLPVGFLRQRDDSVLVMAVLIKGACSTPIGPTVFLQKKSHRRAI
jgi:Isochorismatase family